MLAARITAIALLGSCGDNVPTPDAGRDERVEVALVPSYPTREVDLLFVVQDSPSVLDKQLMLKTAMPRFFDELSAVPGGLPSLHIGVISMDLGTSSENDPQPAPPTGSGAGSCAGNGKAGVLQTNGTTLVTDHFVVDTANADGTRTTNYTGSLPAVTSAILSPGAGGCAFEQPLRAIRVALDNNPTNAGFLRRGDAVLALVLLAEDEECSVASTQIFGPASEALGPLSTFRCTRFGVTCDLGGTTPDEMITVGEKSLCHESSTSSLVMSVAPYAAFIAGLKADPRSILFSTITGPKEPLAIELRMPPGGGTGSPALAHSCAAQGPSGTEVADPGVRYAEAAAAFRRHTFQASCGPDYSAGVTAIARQIRSMVGDTCLTTDIALPADCEVFDEMLDGTLIPIRPCGPTLQEGCYDLVEDVSCTTSEKLSVRVNRSGNARPDSMVSVRCAL